MDLTVYWFMLPVCILVAGMAMFSGISGAALIAPLFFVGFPLLGVPTLTTIEAIATALFLETTGFASGVYGYMKRKLVDWRLAGALILFSLPAGIIGAIFARQVPGQTLKVTYGLAMFVLAYLLFKHIDLNRSENLCGGGHQGVERSITSSSGVKYDYCIHGLGFSRGISVVGGATAGMISTGIGETTLPTLLRKIRMPVAVAAATSTVVVAGTVIGAATTHGIQLAAEGGIQAIPWNLIVWAVPGAIIGAQIGSRLQGRIDETASRRFFSGLFLVIATVTVLAFTVFNSTFSAGS